MNASLTQHEALIYIMVMMSAVDKVMTDAEMERIGRLSRFLPVFEGFNDEQLVSIARGCTQLLAGQEELETTLNQVCDVLPARLYDTAYALAVEIAAADLALRREEIRFLQLLRDRLQLDKLICAAIERAATARFRR